ncbi:MAG: nucleoside deaminase [Phycisphaeraceae bacterium]|nr:nucleoside deaminase [Phycisphaeraceae bacterium]
MGAALEAAKHAAAIGEVPVGAVVYETATQRVVATAHNRRETDKDPCAHAELIAIRQASRAVGDWRLNHCTLVVTLEPCAMCAGTIINARIGRVVFGATDPKAGACGSVMDITANTQLNHAPVIIGGVLSDESSELLKVFFRERRTQRKLR